MPLRFPDRTLQTGRWYEAMLVRLLILTFFVATLHGCGGSSDEGPELVPVSGVVKFDGQPLANADINFIPTEKTAGLGGFARTDNNGKFELTYVRSGSGAPAGQYKVTVSRRLLPDGNPIPEGDETPPIESPARETLPAVYSDSERSELTAVVEKGGKPIEINLDSKGTLP
jgi:hypothetical protein